MTEPTETASSTPLPSPNGARPALPPAAAGNTASEHTAEYTTAAAVPRRRDRGRPRRLSWLKAALGFGPVGRRSVPMVNFLLAHPNRAARWHVQSTGAAGAERIIDRGLPRLEGLVAQADDLRLRAADAEARSAGIEDRVLVDHRGVASTVAAARQQQARLADRLDEDDAAGSTAHRRLGGRVGLARVGLLFDLVAYLLFTSFVFNVDWRQPATTDWTKWVAAFAFAAFAFWATERFASLTGRTLRSWKRGGTAIPAGDWPRRRMIGAGLAVGTVLVTLAPALLMYQRVRHEGQNAPDPGPATMLAVALAVFALLAPLVVMYAEFSRGSTLTDDLNHLSRPLAGAQAEQTRLRQHADDLRRRADRVDRTAERYRYRLLGRARIPVVGADQVVLVAYALTEDLPESRAREVATVSAPVGLLTDGIPVVAYGLDSLTQHMRTPLFTAPTSGRGAGRSPDELSPLLSSQHPLSSQQESGSPQATGPSVDADVSGE